MASVHDVAAYILGRLDKPVSAMKLQKLVYYCQAWHLVWDDEPLFPERIQAWANGPVVYELFDAHRGQYSVSPPWPHGDPSHLTAEEAATVDLVLEDYGGLTGRQLSFLTHSEDPWKDARGDLPPTARSSAEITPEALAAYYSTVDAAEEAKPVDELDWHDWEGFGGTH